MIPRPIDIEAIRTRLARTGPFSLPRWVALDLANLLAEVDALRGERGSWEHRTRRAEATVAGAQRLSNEACAKLDKWDALEAERDALLARVDELTRDVAAAREEALREKQAAAAMEYEAEAERLSVAEWLSAFAATPPPGPISPVRKAAQAFAARAAGLIERGDHRRGVAA